MLHAWLARTLHSIRHSSLLLASLTLRSRQSSAEKHHTVFAPTARCLFARIYCVLGLNIFIKDGWDEVIILLLL